METSPRSSTPAIAKALGAFALLLTAGCTDAVYTFGSLEGDSTAGNRCQKDSSGARVGSGGAADCPATTATGGRRIGSGGAHAIPLEPADAASPDSPDAPPDGPSTECLLRQELAVRKGLNVYLLVDGSLSVVLQPLWGSVLNSITQFIDDPANADIGLGIQFFGTSCNPTDYEKPLVPIADIAVSGPKIKGSYPLPLNGKALGAALKGSISYARTVMGSQPTRETAVVLMSDGILDLLCGSDANAAIAAVQPGFTGTPSVKTYVVALGAGPTLLDPANVVDLTPFDFIAAAGGTTAAARVEVNSSTDFELAAAFDAVVRTAKPCAYAIPTSMRSSRTSLEWRSTKGLPAVKWPQLPDAGSCGTTQAAYIDPVSPSYLTLCPAACAKLIENPDGEVWAREACE